MVRSTLITLLVAACGGGGGGSQPTHKDGSVRDSGEIDGAPDAKPDAKPDGIADANPDANVDASMDAGSDSGTGGEDAEIDTEAPTWPVGSELRTTKVSAATITLEWNEAEDNIAVQAYRLFQDSVILAEFDATTTNHTVNDLLPQTTYLFKIEARDAATNWSLDGPSLTVTTVLPPDPTSPDVAPTVDPTVPTSFPETVDFLYNGDDKVQFEVAEEAINPRCVVVLCGNVANDDGSPLDGVRVTVANQPEFGFTLTRNNGKFDLATNGGGWVTVHFEKDGYIPVDRQVQTPWQDFVIVPDVVMVPYNETSPTVDLTETLDPHVAQEVVEEGADRQAVVYFPPGTVAHAVLSDDTLVELSTITLCATEFTVGDSGPDAMPAPLPPNSAYTYAVDLTVVEAQELGAKSVVFDLPVYLYVDNFLGFAVGENMPVGTYRPDGCAAWAPSDNGQVIALIDEVDGLAVIDSNGDGFEDDPETLAALGLASEERQKLAELYDATPEAPKELWRIPRSSFSILDANPSRERPEANPWFEELKEKAQNMVNSANKWVNSCSGGGSIIEYEAQTLRETLPIVGTPFTLNYSSARMPGRTDAYNSVDIPLSGDTLAEGLQRIELDITVAGQHHHQVFDDPVENMTVPFTWDGKDAYGRLVQGGQTATIRVTHLIEADYLPTPRFGENGDGTVATGVPTRELADAHLTWTVTLGGFSDWKAMSPSIGGWSLNVHHTYDSRQRMLYLGDGSQRSSEASEIAVVTTVVGNGSFGYLGDGGPATEAQLTGVAAVAVAPDGSLYLADQAATVGNDQVGAVIRRVDAQTGIIDTVAGYRLTPGSTEATQTILSEPRSLAVAPDGSVYIAEIARIRRLVTDGTLTTVAGTGLRSGASANGTLATSADIAPESIDVAADCTVYFYDYDSASIRRIDPAPPAEALLRKVVGNQPCCGEGWTPGDAWTPEGTLATQVSVGSIDANGLTVDADGNVYFAMAGAVWRVGPDGLLHRSAGHYGGSTGALPVADGVRATDVYIPRPGGVSIDWQGALYFIDGTLPHWVYHVAPDGILTTFAGQETDGYGGDLGPAAAAKFSSPRDLAVAPDGAVYIVDTYNYRVRRIAPALRGFDLTDIVIPSSDGPEVYVFDYRGRHVRTVHSLTGATLYTFGYDSSGCLDSVTDVDDNPTLIERPDGITTVIVGTYGARTTLTVDAEGYLSTVINPAEERLEQVGLTYFPGGLLATLTDARSGLHEFIYDSQGRLTHDENASDGVVMLTRNDGTPENAIDYTVQVQTPAGLSKSYAVVPLNRNDQSRVFTNAVGLTVDAMVHADGTSTLLYPDDTSISSTNTADPRLGILSPLVNEYTIELGSLTHTIDWQRTSLPADDNPLAAASQVDTITINGRTYTSSFDRSTATTTQETPTHRQRVITIELERNRPTRTEVVDLTPVDYVYDDYGRLAGISQAPRSTTLSYNDNGRLAAITTPLTETSFVHDSVGRPISVIRAGDNVTSYTYDAHGNITSISPPGEEAHVFSYTANDQLETYTPTGGATATYEYNPDGRTTRAIRADGQAIVFSYDPFGRRSTRTTEQGSTTTYAYHATTGRLITIDNDEPGETRDVTLSYDYEGPLLTGLAWSGVVVGSVDLTYDEDFRVVRTALNGEHPVDYAYDEDGLLMSADDLSLTRDPDNGIVKATAVSGAHSVTTEQSHNEFGELAEFHALLDESPLYSFVLTRDAEGRIGRIVETIEGDGRTVDYSFDTLGRLLTTTATTYDYDANGNRLSRTAGADVESSVYNEKDELVDYDEFTYTYTPNGELATKSTNEGITTYTYDGLGRLFTVVVPDGTPNGKTIEYVLDGIGRRVAKRKNTATVATYLYESPLRVAAEFDQAGALRSRFVYGVRANVPVLMIRDNVVYRFLSDAIGSPRLIVNTETGTVEQRLDYDEFGRVVSDSHPGFQPFGFAGGLYDADTGLVHFGARDYDATVGRFVTKDPIPFAGGETNAYVYARNDPVNLTDPYGLFAPQPPKLQEVFVFGGVSVERPGGGKIEFFVGGGLRKPHPKSGGIPEQYIVPRNQPPPEPYPTEPFVYGAVLIGNGQPVAGGLPVEAGAYTGGGVQVSAEGAEAFDIVLGEGAVVVGPIEVGGGVFEVSDGESGNFVYGGTHGPVSVFGGGGYGSPTAR